MSIKPFLSCSAVLLSYPSGNESNYTNYTLYCHFLVINISKLQPYLHKQISAYECSICREREKMLVSEVFCFLFVVRIVLTEHVSADFGCSQVNFY